ncbi:MAG: transglycosylase domain-containing protein [Peptococcaceae bacterium]|nr:transglycosylase domain-containing protein [Peptococcaceae bacterium]
MRFIKRLFILACLLLTLLTWSIYEHPMAVARVFPFLPNITRMQLSTDTPKTVVRGSTQLLQPIPNVYVPLQEIPITLCQAVVAIEDQRFYQHKGVDFYGVARAIFTDLTSQHAVEGASTITQQLARNLYLSPTQTVRRKLTEALLALQLEDYYKNKGKILELYLNNIYYGRNAWGIKAAATAYFGTSDVSTLSVAQCAFLAGLPQSPSYFANNIPAALAKQKLIIQKMQALGYLPDNFVDVLPQVLPGK